MTINHTEMKSISEVEINGLNAAENRLRDKARENYKKKKKEIENSKDI